MNAPLDDRNLLAVMIDGIHIKDHLVLIALGIDDDGNKHVLGLWERATENHRVCSALLANLIERGLPVNRSLLFIVDGSKALTKAIRKTFGELALIQRCQVHKIRNVLDYLPKEKPVGVRKAIRDAYASPSASAADKRLRALAGQLKAAGHPSASASMLEGLAETLTVKRLGVAKSIAPAGSTCIRARRSPLSCRGSWRCRGSSPSSDRCAWATAVMPIPCDQIACVFALCTSIPAWSTMTLRSAAHAARRQCVSRLGDGEPHPIYGRTAGCGE